LFHFHPLGDRQQRAPIRPPAIAEVLRHLGLKRGQRLGVIHGPAQHLPP
jgi:hypothetical protein